MRAVMCSPAFPSTRLRPAIGECQFEVVRGIICAIVNSARSRSPCLYWMRLDQRAAVRSFPPRQPDERTFRFIEFRSDAAFCGCIGTSQSTDAARETHRPATHHDPAVQLLRARNALPASVNTEAVSCDGISARSVLHELSASACCTDVIWRGPAAKRLQQATSPATVQCRCAALVIAVGPWPRGCTISARTRSSKSG